MTWLVRIACALAALALALAMEWQRPDMLVRLDEGLRDAFVRWSAQPTGEDRVVVVDIGDAALRELGPWPWPRQNMADLVEILLSQYGAKAVGLDIVLPQAGAAQGDARLAALATFGPLSLAQIFDYGERVNPVREGVLSGGMASNTQPHTQAKGLPASGFIANHPGLQGARCVGNVGYQPDQDGVLRHIPTVTLHQGLHYPSLSQAVLACADTAVQAPANVNGLWRVPYTYAQEAYTVIDAADLLRERIPKSMVQGRFVLVGSSSLGLGDQVSTPLSPLTAGVMVHAASLSGLLDMERGVLQFPRSGRPLLVAWCALSLMLIVAGFARLTAMKSVLLLAGLMLAWLGVAFVGASHQLEWSVSAPLWGYVLLLFTAIPYEWWRTQRQGRRLLATFSHYVAQPVLDEIVRRDLQHSLEPSLCDITVLVADMAGYTQLTSSLSLNEAADVTKAFLGCLTRPVLSGRGTLDRYSGDGLVAFWGAPLPCPEQADLAVQAALDMLAEVDAFNAERARAGLAPAGVRIGIESGRALVGDLGTPFRSTYTAVGDCINFASRLEAAGRELQCSLVIGAAANAMLTQHATTALGQIQLRATETRIEVFTVQR